MNLSEIANISQKITEIAQMIPKAKNQLDCIKENFNEGDDISMKIEDDDYLDFEKQEVVLFLTTQIEIMDTKIKTLGKELNKLL